MIPPQISRDRSRFDLVFASVTALAATTVIFISIAILSVLLDESALALKQFGWRFIFTETWDPVGQVFGGAASIYGTVVTTLLALLLGVPVSIGIAIFVTEVSPNMFKGPIGGAIELLAAIPSIIYGMWGLFTISPIMGKYVEPFLQRTIGQIPFLSFAFAGVPRGIDLLTAGLILGIMVIPFIASIARDSFNLTPDIVKESAYALGATNWEVVRHIVIPHSLYGIVGGIIIALGRALGETMAVAFVLGNKHTIATSFFDAAATITVTLANEFTEADGDLYFSSLYYLALLLFLFSFITLAVARFFVSRIQKPGEK